MIGGVNDVGGGQNQPPVDNAQPVNQGGGNNRAQIAAGGAVLGNNPGVAAAPPAQANAGHNLNDANGVRPPQGRLISARQFQHEENIDLEAFLDEPPRELSEDEIRFMQDQRNESRHDQNNAPRPQGRLISAGQFLHEENIDIEAFTDEAPRELSSDEIRLVQTLQNHQTEWDAKDHIAPSYLTLANIFVQNFKAYWSEVNALNPVPPQLNTEVSHNLTVPLTENLTNAGLENLRFCMELMELDHESKAKMETQYGPLIELQIKGAIQQYCDDLANADLTSASVDEYTDDFLQDVIAKILQLLVTPMSEDIRETPGLISSLRNSVEHSVITAMQNALPGMDELSELRSMFPAASIDEIVTQLDNYAGLTLDNIRVEVELLDQARAQSGRGPYVSDGTSNRLDAIFSLADMRANGWGNIYNITHDYYTRS